MVFQNPGASLNPRRTVGQSIEVPLAAHGFPGDRRRRVGRICWRWCNYPGISRTAIRTNCRAGRKQRVAIARALAVRPALLVLDEPTSALDVSVQATCHRPAWTTLGRQLGLTYLFISHDLSLMRNFAQTVGVLYLGKIVETGPVARSLNDPQHDYTRLLLASVPVISAEEEAMRPDNSADRRRNPTAENLIALRAGAIRKGNSR